MLHRVPLLLLSVLCFPSPSQQTLPNGKPDFSGKWQLEQKGEQKSAGSMLIIEQDASEIRLRDAQTATDAGTNVKCGTTGKECAAKVDGHDARVTFWYNGPTLEEMSTSGDNVTKIRRTISADGKKLEVEVLSIVPTGKDPEKLTFVRSDATEQRADTKVP